MNGDAIGLPAEPDAEGRTVAPGAPMIEIVAISGQLGIDALPVAGSGRAGAFLAGYLRSDIAGSVRAARAVLAGLDAIEAGRIARWSESGNAYELTLEPQSAGLTFAYAGDPSDDRVHIAPATLRTALDVWIAALERRPSSA